MKHVILFLFALNIIFAQDNVVKVANFKGIQVTGITVTENGRVFANFPRWRKNVPFSLVEIKPDGTYFPYPNQEINSWEVGKPITDQFVAIQSVVAHKNKLYVLETSNPLFQGVIASPKIYVYDLDNNKLITTYIFPEETIKEKSYINDLRIDDKKSKIYCTDSGESGLIIIDTKNNNFQRILDKHPYTLAEVNHLNFKDQIWTNTVHSDGIELDSKHDILYFHALTGYTLYGIKTKYLLNAKKLAKVKPLIVKTGAVDGMIMDKKGNLYFADLENDKIQYLTPTYQIKTLLEGKDVKWADTFSIYQGYLYYSNSRINETQTTDINLLDFTINKVKLP